MQYTKKRNPTTKPKRQTRRRQARAQINAREEQHRQKSREGGHPGALGMPQGQNGEQGATEEIPITPQVQPASGT